MAAEDEGRTEEPSEYKLEKARKEGKVAKSQEISGALVLLLSVVMIILFAKQTFVQMTQMFVFYFERINEKNLRNPAFIAAFFSYFFRIIIPPCAVGIIAAILGNIIQTRGFIFSFKPIVPNFSKIVPNFGEYLKRTLFSGKGLFNIAKSFFKVGVIVFIAYLYISKDLKEIALVIQTKGIGFAIAKISSMAAQILLTVAIIFLLIAIPDYIVQRRDFREQMKMTKQEVKEEFKEMEGDPEVKSRLQQKQRELLQQNIPKAVAESDVVIANPEHFAVALQYDQNEADFPVVKAKGQDEVAQTIKRIARENDVPIVEDRATARGLYTQTEVGDIIPEEYYQTIALIYSQVLYNS